MKQIATQMAKEVIRHAGFEVRRLYDHGVPVTTEQRRFTMLRHNRINVVIDVGAHVGEYGSHVRRSGFQGRIFSFEPMSAAFAQVQNAALRDPNWRAFPFAIGEREGETEINISGNSFSSSLLPMLDTHKRTAPDSEYVAKETVRLTTLDRLIAPLIAPTDRLHLKMDTQGYEHRVLEGASAILPQVHLIECELSLVPLYDGQYTFMDMLTLLGRLGFRPVHFDSFFVEPETAYALQVDGLFARL